MSRKQLPIYTFFVILLSVAVTLVFSGGLRAGYAGEQFTKLLQVSRLLEQYSLYGVDEEEASEAAVKSYVNTVGDPYTTYFNKEELQDFTEQVEGKYYGVGLVVLTRADDDRVMVSRCIEGSPAQEAGIQRGDQLLEVDGNPVSAQDVDTAVAMIKGEAQTTVKLTLLRESTGETFDVSLVREEIVMHAVESEMLDGGVGLIRVSSFNQSADVDFKNAVESLISQGATAAVIDLRDNPGGIFQVCTKMCDYLLPEGTIVYTQDKNADKEIEESDADAVDLKLAVLVNGQSASAAEIMTAALKDFGRAVIVGEQTFGKGIVQSTFDLDDSTALKVTVSEYFSPNGTKIQGIGVTPDIVEPLDEAFATTAIEDIPHEQDNQLQRALQALAEGGQE